MLAAALSVLLAAQPDPPFADRHPAEHYLVPAAEVTVFEVGLELVDRFVLDADFARISSASVRANFAQGPRFDNDAIFVNFLGHPYHGAIVYGFARSSGLGFWWSSLYTLTGDAAWEWLAEVQAPSINDLVESGPGGTLWGEAFYRIARLLLSRRGDGPWLAALRTVLALAVDPPATFNHAIAPALDEPDPAGASFTADLYGGALVWTGAGARTQGLIGVDFWYAEPGSCVRPFDQFELHIAAGLGGVVTGNGGVRGYLFGCRFGDPELAGGTWGLTGATRFGTGDGFRWSTTSFGPGATVTLHQSPWALKASAHLEAVAMGAAGSIAQTDYVEVRDTVPGTSHYSMGPGGLGLVELELAFAERARLRASAGSTWVVALVPPGGGAERIDQVGAALEGDLPAHLFARLGVDAAWRKPARPAESAQAGWAVFAAIGATLSP